MVGHRIEQLAMVGIDSRGHSAARMSPSNLAAPTRTPGEASERCRMVQNGAEWHVFAAKVTLGARMSIWRWSRSILGVILRLE